MVPLASVGGTGSDSADVGVAPRRARWFASPSAWAWLAVATTWLYVFPYHRDLNNPNENARVYQTIAMAQHHTTAMDLVVERFGWVNDMAMRDERLANGQTVRHYYAGKAPGTSLAGVGPYALARAGYLKWAHREPTLAEAVYWLRLLTMVLPSIAFLWVFRGHLLPRLGETWTAHTLVAWGLGTMAAPYTMMFASHQHTAIAMFSAFLCARTAALRDRAGEGNWRIAVPLLAAGGFASLAAMSEYPLGLAVICLFVYVVATLQRRWQAVAYVVGGLPGAVILGTFHKLAFGKVTSPAYAHLANPTFAEETAQGFFGMVKPSVESVTGTLFAPDYGLFVFSPLLLLGLIAVVHTLFARRSADDEPLQRADAALALGLFVVMVMFNASMNIWRAGWCVGPRYIAVLTPFLALWAALGVRRWSREAPPWRVETLATVAGGFGLIGLLLSGLSGLCYPHYPVIIANPVFELLLPILRQGLLPHHAGELIGEPGWRGVAPLLAVLAGAVVLVSAATRTRLWRLPLSLLLAACLLMPYAQLRGPVESTTEMVDFVRQHWESPTKPPVR